MVGLTDNTSDEWDRQIEVFRAGYDSPSVRCGSDEEQPVEVDGGMEGERVRILTFRSLSSPEELGGMQTWQRTRARLGT